MKWKLVPVEPTEAMSTAAQKCWEEWENGHIVTEMWPAMLSAAPPPPYDELVEKGARAIWERHIPDFEYDSIQYAAQKYRESARAVLAAIGIREDGE